MTILHIANINDAPNNGMSLVIPKYIEYQGQFADVGFINCTNIKFEELNNQFSYNRGFKLSTLPPPFNKPDLVVLHGAYQLPIIKLAYKLRKYKIPYIYVPHGCLTKVSQKKNRKKKIIANFLFFNKFVNSAAAIQFLSEQELKNSVGKSRRFIGTNGIEIPIEIKKKFHMEEDMPLRFVYVGRLEKYHKGLDILIEAFARQAIRDLLAMGKISVDIYGPDMYGRLLEIKTLADEKNILSLIGFHAPVYGSSKETVILSSDVFIQTSRSEGMPMGILEALSFGLPCVVTEGTNLRNIVEKYDAGWGCDTTVDDVADTILKVYQERQQLLQKSQNARKLIKENFTWDKVTEETMREYENICK